MSRRTHKTRFADPAANVAWAGILCLEEGTQHELLERLRARLADPQQRDSNESVQKARAVDALRQATRMLDHSPSVKDFRRLRETNPDLGWPSDGSIRTWLGGGWNDALKGAGLDAVPEHLAVALKQSEAFQPAEVEAALREYWAEAERDGEKVSFHSYRCWAKRPDVRRREGRRPMTQSVFDRIYGGFPNALAAAGLVRDEGTGPGVASRRGAGYRYTLEQLDQAMLEVSARTGGHLPTQARYKEIREQILDEEEAAGLPPRAFASYDALVDRWGKWSTCRQRVTALSRGKKQQPIADGAGDPSPASGVEQ